MNNALKIQLSDALLKTDGIAWITSYDQYLPTIREHADKRSKSPHSGKEMFKILNTRFVKEIKEIKKLQKLVLHKSRLFKKDLDMAIKNPQLGWREWSKDDKG